MPDNSIEIGDEVRTALAEKRPVLALESTIISHGMPYPQNVETAVAVEKNVREAGAVPATIAILSGRLKAGLSTDEIDLLGRKGQEVMKTSRRDIPLVVSRKLHGATTVAATMIIAAMAGIRVFATGGIGGVHRNAEKTFDISADLEELARTNVAVVCAGVKSILDIGLTLEYLETKGVPVIGFGTDEMPAFYTRESGYTLDLRMDHPIDVARLLKAKWDLGLSGGAVIANPIPAEHALDPAQVEAAIEDALAEMDARGISGKASTPFLLSRVSENTGGDSLDANIQLVYNNARVGADIALELAGLLTQ